MHRSITFETHTRSRVPKFDSTPGAWVGNQPYGDQEVAVDGPAMWLGDKSVQAKSQHLVWTTLDETRSHHFTRSNSQTRVMREGDSEQGVPLVTVPTSSSLCAIQNFLAFSHPPGCLAF